MFGSEHGSDFNYSGLPEPPNYFLWFILIFMINCLDIIDKMIYEIKLINTDMAEESQKSTDWQELTHLTQGRSIVVERVRLRDKDIAIEGRFDLPQLARLNMDDQIFVVAFVRSHGSIKEMERIFGVSYPTIKSRLNRIAGSLEFVETDPAPSKSEILQRLHKGEITAQEAIRELEVQK